MDSKLQKAYRDLLYWGLLLMRSGPRGLSWLAPWRIPRELHDYYRTKELADALHNLAMFSEMDFEGFDESRFWSDLERVPDFHGGPAVEVFRQRFEWYVSGE